METVDAVMHGYREPVQLTDDELERLPAVANMRPIWLACADYRSIITRWGKTPTLEEGWTKWRPEQGDQLAERAIAALRR